MGNKLTAKQYLEQLQELDTNINQDLERLDEMRVGATCIGSIDYSRERVQASSSEGLSDEVIRYIALDEHINEEIDRFINAREQIIKEIRGLHVNNYIQVLFKVYVQFKSIKTAAFEMGMSYAYVRELHRKALEMFEKIYKNLQYHT